MAAELLVDAPEQVAGGSHREVAGDRAEPAEGGSAHALRPLRSRALQNRSRTCGTTTIEVTRWSRSASKMTRGLRLRTYRMSAPTDRA